MTPVIPDFEYRRVSVADDVTLNAAVGGSGSPVVLLHGFPQTHLMWRHVAADLATDHTVICPALRGYGDSDKPAESDATTYSKRTMGHDIVALAAALGHERFALAGHDAVRSLRSGRPWTTPRSSPTWAAWMSCPPWTCGTSCTAPRPRSASRSEEHTSELGSLRR